MLPPAPSAPHHYFLRIAYDGTNYSGWQRQANASLTIQQTIEERLSQIHDREISIVGCSRTDAGVHATQFYAYVRHEDALPDNYVFFANQHLPPDIALLEAIPIHDGAHACLDATRRTYDYFFHDFEDVWLARASGRVDLREFAPQVTADLLPLLLEHSDFRAFCKTPDRHNSTIAHISEATIYRDAAGDRFRLRFVADRFLRGMIRVLVDELLSVGMGLRPRERFVDLLVRRERDQQYELAPAEGLFLTGVCYPYLDRKPELPLSGSGDWIAIESRQG